MSLFSRHRLNLSQNFFFSFFFKSGIILRRGYRLFSGVYEQLIIKYPNSDYSLNDLVPSTRLVRWARLKREISGGGG